MVTLRPGYVSDPVHEYIPFTGIERQIIDHLSTQRLRRISQTGLSNYIYPELVSSRFGHALGAMHLASTFFAACFRNSDREAREALVNGIVAAVGRLSHGEQANFMDADQYELPWHELAAQSNAN